MATRSSNFMKDEESKVIYALIDERWNAEKSSVSCDDDYDDDRPITIQQQGHVGRDNNSPSPSSSYNYSIPLPKATAHPPNSENDGVGIGGSIASLTTAEQWYEYYARRYPSRGFLERRQREWEDEEKERLKIFEKERRKNQQQGGGWLLRFLFGWGSSDSEDATDDKTENDDGSVGIEGEDDDSGSSNGSSMGEDAPEEGVFTDSCAADGMCGTASLLDHDAIAHEALAFHRFHLVSEHRALCKEDKFGWNVVLPVRQGVGGDVTGEGERNVPYYCIVGCGQIAEFPSLDGAAVMENQDKNDRRAKVTLTSDWKLLLSLVNHDNDNAHSPPHDLRHCRAASIGRDCLVVSWGREDGWIVFYRRIERPTKQTMPKKKHATTNDEQMLEIGWEVVAAASPSKSVIHAASKNMSPDPYHNQEGEDENGGGDEMQQERRLYDSGSLYVTDLMPMVINNNRIHPPSQHLNGAEQSPPPAVFVPSSAVLAISRLGGFVELLPLPSWIWQPSKSSPPPSSTKNFLPNLTASSKTTAFSTSQHHLDIMSMDAYRTSVGPDSEWDEKRHPERPPAELVLALCGRSSDDSSEAASTCLTLWGITAVHAFPQQQQQQREEGYGGGEMVEPTFDLRVQRIGHMDLENVGADASLFLSDATSDHWAGVGHDRPPPNIRGCRKRKNPSPSSLCSTITATAPLVSLRFTPDDPACNSRNNRVLLAALDFNGGVSVMDCTEMVRSAEHAMDLLYDGAASAINKDGPKIHLLCDRETSMSIVSKGKRSHGRVVARASQIEWWSRHGAVDESSSFMLASYATLIQSRKNTAGSKTAMVRLQQWTSSFDGKDEPFAKGDPRDVFCIPCSDNIASSSVALLLPMSLGPLHPQETLSFLQMSAESNNYESSSVRPLPSYLSIRGVRKFPEPDEIIASLLRRGDPSKALEVARRFGGAEHFGGKVMNECRIRLWEDQRDVLALRLVSDDGYVMRQAMELLECCGNENSDMELKGLTLDNLLDIFKEAVARCDGLNKESGIAVFPDALPQLRNSIRRLGTFTLLLNHFTTDTDRSTFSGQISADLFTRRFLCDFQHDSLIDIASCAAAQGDIDALTVLLTRHPVSMRQRMKLLNLVPMGMEISSYEHLLPCCTTTEDSSRESSKDAQFLPKSTSEAQFLNPMQFFTYLSDRQLQQKQAGSKTVREVPKALDIFKDDADRDHLMLHFWEGIYDDPATTSSDPSNASTKAEVATWFLKRAIDLHNETGQILSVKEVCEAGLIRLGFVSFSTGNGAYEVSGLNDVSASDEEESQSAAVEKLIYFYSATSLFCHILVDKLKEPLSSDRHLNIESLSEQNKDLFMSVIQFCSMEVSETLPFILESGSDTCNSISTFQKHVSHFVDRGQCLAPMDTTAGASTITSFIESEDLASILEHEMLELCLDKVKRLRKEKKISSALMQDAPSLSCRLEESLSMCADFASLGIRSQSSIIQSEDGLINFAGKIFCSVLYVVEGEWGLMTERVISMLWSIFELLPSITTAPNGLGDESQGKINHQKSLHFQLVVVQLCWKWRGRRAIPHELWKMLRNGCSGDEGNNISWNKNEWAKNLCMAGHNVIAIMCRGFCDIVLKGVGLDDDDKGRSTSQQQDIDLLFDFVSDIDEFDKRYFSSGVQLSGCLGKYLFVPLLSQHSFLMLKQILKIRSGWFRQDFLCSVVISFVWDAASTSRDDKLLAAMACQEMLGPFFPNLAAEFEHRQCMFYAKQFMSEAMKLDPILLEQLFSSSVHSEKPIALIQALMATSPQAILLGCEFWSDELSASNACTDASVYFTSQICASLNGGGPAAEEESSHVLPPMPGALVMQLANILGYHNSHDLLLVKRCMVKGALKLGLGPAAVAICYSMLCDAAFSRHGPNTPCDITTWTSQHELQVLDCVVSIVSDQSLSEVQIKKEVCTMAFRLFSNTDSTLYHVMLDAFKDLEYQLLVLETNSIVSPGAEQPPGTTEGTQHSEFLVFKAAGLVARQARDFVDNSKISNVVEQGNNNFYDRSMTRAFCGIKQSSLVDLLQLLSLTGGRYGVREKLRQPSKRLDIPSSEKPSLGGFSEAVFNWVVSEAFKARRSSYSSSLPASNISMMTELGSSCLTDLVGHDTASLIINQALEDYNAKMLECTSSAKENITSLDHSIQPDISIVKRLNDRGYGWNAARRAVIMTKNQGYSMALTWAVSHFQDDDFDSPIYFLHADSSAHLDQSLVDMTGELLRLVQRNLKEKRTRTGIANRDLAKRAADNGYATGLSDAASLRAKSKNTTISTKKDFVSKLPSSLNFGGKHPVQLTPKNGSRNDRPRPPNSAESISSVEGSLSSRASIKKQIKRGKITLGTQKLSLEERKKLAMKGKKLLDAARAKNKKVIAPPTTITTSRHAPS